MRIARVLMLLSNGFDPDPRVLAEARAFAAGGHSVIVLAWDRDGRSPRVEQLGRIRVERIRIRSTHGRGCTQAPFLALYLGAAVARGLRLDFDAVWAHDLDTLPAAWLLGRMRASPLVFDAHESYPDMVAASLGRWPMRLLAGLERRLVRRVSAVVTVGERLARHYREMGARRVVVAGNWKDPTPPVDRARLRAGLGVPEQAFLVSDIGWLGTDRQLAPLAAAVRSHPQVWALIGGRGPMEPEVRRSAARCPRIRYLGWVDGDRIPELTAASDAVFYGFDPACGNARFSAPNKLFEAIAAGVPVITGPFGEIAEIVRRERIGVVLEDYRPRAIRHAFDVLSTKEACGERCRALQSRYTRSRADHAILGLLDRLLRSDTETRRVRRWVPSCR